MFSHRGRLLCLYSVIPYILLKIDLQRGQTRTITAIDNLKIDLRQWSPGSLCNSTNPIVWDEDHYVTFIHFRFESINHRDRNRLYLQFGMLIDRQTLLPVSVISKPLATGGSETGRHTGVHYTMSLVAGDDVLYAFYGEGDMHCTAAWSCSIKLRLVMRSVSTTLDSCSCRVFLGLGGVEGALISSIVSTSVRLRGSRFAAIDGVLGEYDRPLRQ